MRYILVVLFSFFAAMVSYGQSLKEKEFIRYFFKSSLYTDRLYDHHVMMIHEALQPDTLRSLERHLYEADSVLVLTSKEKAFVNSEVAKLTTIRWNENLLEKGTLVVKDSLSGQETQSSSTRRLHRFSKPIFIRNDSVCIFYYDYFNLGCVMRCGTGTLQVYKKKNNNWLLWLTLMEWVS
ncbi:hypothetical protein [Telluribacter sp. SYSU D00476]|uniref:hypothetical protein n=1 Tax=Telluribacter sp. SYSU D00476 TaxID=2811430 RepID=UPI001FF426B4|nr:hypothetical protein [Telluribacter sp. SYSU D00476]